MDERAGTAETPGHPEAGGENRRDGPVTRRSLLAWLGKASVVGLFSPVIDACVRASGTGALDPGGPGDFGGGADAGFDGAGETPGDVAAEEAPGDLGSADAAPSDEGPALDGDEVAAEDVAAGDAVSPPCDPAFAPGSDALPVPQNWGERTVDRQDLAALLATWRLTIDGLVDTPLTFDFCQLRDLGLVDQVTDFHCVEGWDVLDVPWNGIPLSRLLDLAGIRPEARFLKFTSVGGTYTESLPLAVAREPRTLLALGIGGNTLSLRHGFPVRIVVPRLFGYKNPKFVTRIEASVVEHVGFWPRVGYTVAGEVQPSRLREGKY
jgi:DMSO/TMAO reductase YedYZ molybdopterin-dependent catalytic subunit